MITDDRKLQIRHKMWALAHHVLIETANTRTAMPFLTDEEYEYASEFLVGIAKVTKPGNYQEPDDDGWCEECGEEIGLESHYHCSVCGEICSLAGHPACVVRAEPNE